MQKARHSKPLRRIVVAIVAGVLIALSLWQLERGRLGLETERTTVGNTPVTYLSRPDADGPVVVIAHGFAGSRQFMQAYGQTLAHAGYRIALFDLQGHGRNPVPMSGDVTVIEGTTARLVDETVAVARAALERAGTDAELALLGHSMASDIVVRAARELPRTRSVIGVSMYSEAVSADFPRDLLIITGQWEPHLRQAAIAALAQVEPTAQEGDTATAGDVRRRAVVADWVGHVGVLYAPSALKQARTWLDHAFGRPVSADPVPPKGAAIAGLLAGIFILAWPLAGLVPNRARPTSQAAPAVFWAALIGPAIAAPLLAQVIAFNGLPVLVADDLMVILGLYGALQLVILGASGLRITAPALWPTLGLVAYGIFVFGLAMDRYVASFWPIAERTVLIGVLMLGTVVFMTADAAISDAGRAPVLRRVAIKLSVFASLGFAIALDFEGLFFLVLILPVIALFFFVFGTMGRWVGKRAGPSSAGLALGILLAWSLGVTFPMFDDSTQTDFSTLAQPD